MSDLDRALPWFALSGVLLILMSLAILLLLAVRTRAARRAARRDAHWSGVGMNVLLLMMLMAPYADRMTL